MKEFIISLYCFLAYVLSVQSQIVHIYDDIGNSISFQKIDTVKFIHSDNLAKIEVLTSKFKDLGIELEEITPLIYKFISSENKETIYRQSV